MGVSHLVTGGSVVQIASSAPLTQQIYGCIIIIIIIDIFVITSIIFIDIIC